MKFSDQVVEALRICHPERRRKIRRALDDLARGVLQDTRPLEDELAGFFRLRVVRFRLIYRLSESKEVMVEYLAPRKMVYESFKARKPLR
jgi:mRNA interferase RelE/StbE